MKKFANEKNEDIVIQSHQDDESLTKNFIYRSINHEKD